MNSNSKIGKALAQEQALADAIVKMYEDNDMRGHMAVVFSGGPNAPRHALIFARELFKRLGIQTAYDAMLDQAIAEEAIKKIDSAALKAVVSELGAISLEQLKVLSLILDSVIAEKEVDPDA